MRYLYHVLLASLGFITAIVSAQSLESSLQIGGLKNDDVMSVERDIAGNIYVVGQFSNIVDFNPTGTPVQLQTNSSFVNLGDVFIAKYYKNKLLAWVVPIGGQALDRGLELLLDDSLNVYATGFAVGNIDFDPSSAVYELQCSQSERFIIKLGNDGSFKAVNKVSGAANNLAKPEELFKDNQGNIYMYAGGDLHKFDSSLNLIWSKTVEGYAELYDQSEIQVIEYDQSINGPYALGTGLYFKRYNTATGDLINSTLIGETEGDLTNTIVERMNNGDLLLYGRYWGTLSLNGGGNTIELQNYSLYSSGNSYESREYVCRYDASGNLLWAKDFEDKGPNPKLFREDDQGNIYAFGNVNYYADFDPVTPNVQFAENQMNNSYIAKYDSEFNNLVVSQFLGLQTNINDVQFYDDDLVLCGDFYQPIDLDLSWGNQMMETNGIHDGFILEYSNYQSLFIDEAVETHFGVLTNPLTGMTQVNINSTSISEHMISVYDLNGRVLNRLNSENNTINLDLSAYPNGTYFIQVSNAEWSATEKVVK